MARQAAFTEYATVQSINKKGRINKENGRIGMKRKRGELDGIAAALRFLENPVSLDLGKIVNPFPRPFSPPNPFTGLVY